MWPVLGSAAWEGMYQWISQEQIQLATVVTLLFTT